MVKIRLSKKKGKAMYSIVAMDSRTKRDGEFIELIGHYHPLLAHDNPLRLAVNLAAVDRRLGQGAQLTERVAKLVSLARSK